MKLQIPLSLSLLLFAVAAPVQAQYSYSTNNGTITITKYLGSEPWASVSIPRTINGLSVTCIGSNAFFQRGIWSVYIPDSVVNIEGRAFYDAYLLEYVSIPGSVTNIGESAFSGCPLSSLVIPDSVISIGSSAFSNCKGVDRVVIGNGVNSIGAFAFFLCKALKSVSIGNNLARMGPFAFYECIRLESMEVNSANPVYSSTNGVLFNKDKSTLILYPRAKVGNYEIPSSVKNIGAAAFAHTYNLWNVTIPDGVTNIDESAFYNCSTLSSITIPSSVIRVGNFAFESTPLTTAYFQGNAPAFSTLSGESPLFLYERKPTVYYLPGTTGWGPTFSGARTEMWKLPNPVILSFSPGFGVSSNGFGFRISWAAHAGAVVEASTNLVNPSWSPLQTNTLIAGASDFYDPFWKSHPHRFYRVRSP